MFSAFDKIGPRLKRKCDNQQDEVDIVNKK